MNCSKKSPKKKGCALRRERKVTTSHKWTWADSSSWKQDADPLIHTQDQEHLCTKWTILPKEKKWITIPTNYRRWSVKTVSIDKFAQDGARDFSDDQWSQQVLGGSTKKRIEYYKDKDGVLCYSGAVQGHSGGIAVGPKIMGYFLISQHWKKYLYQRGRSCDCQSVLDNGLIPWGKETDKARQAVFLTPTNPFGNDPEEERAHDDLTVPQKGPSITSWKPSQNAVFWVRLSEAEDLGLEFWQTKSCAIMTYATTLGDCIVWHQMVEIEYFYERLETPRPPRKVTLSKYWQCQQQHSTSGTDVPSFLWQRQKSEDLPEVQDGSKHILEVDQAWRWFKENLYSRTSGEGKHWIQSRVHSSRPRHGQRWAHWIEDFWNSSMSLMRTRRIWGDNSLHMWKAYPTEPGDDTMY